MKLSNLLAVAGALALIAGLAVIRPAYGLISLGVLLLLGALAFSDLARPSAPTIKDAPANRVESK